MAEQSTDQWSARATVIGGIILALALVSMQFALIMYAFTKPADQLLVYIAALVPIANLSGVAVGAIYNALNTRSGSSPEDMQKLVEYAQGVRLQNNLPAPSPPVVPPAVEE